MSNKHRADEVEDEVRESRRKTIETFRFEELDSETQQYLLYARDQQGKGTPGVFAPKPFYLPIAGVVLGFAIMVTTLFLTIPPTNHPVREAMLQTAGFLLGGWMIVAALRVWAGGKSGSYPGHFVYADPDNLYEAKGSVVEVTDLYDLRDAKAVSNFNDGKYQNTDVTVKVGKKRHSVQVNDEERGRRLTVFLNTVAYCRDGGEDGNDEELRRLSPEAMGAVAKQVARTGEFPRRLSDAGDAELVRVPQPRREGSPSHGVLAMAVTLLIGVGLFFAFRLINAPLRDHAVFNKVKAIPAKDQAPALRMYLANDAFSRHRDEALQLLAAHYERGVAAHVKGTDPQMKEALSEVILDLAKKPAPVASLVVVEELAPPGQNASSGTRESAVQQKLADKWGSTIGDELVVFAVMADPDDPSRMDKKVRGMFDLRWKFSPDNGELEYTMEFRKGPDENPVFTRKGSMPLAGNADQTAQALADKILEQTVGTPRMRQPPPPPEDF